MMLTELCQELKNWFDRGQAKYIGSFKIVDGVLLFLNKELPLKEGQYFRIIGSLFNDGVHQYNSEDPVALHDEDFDGAVWSMAVPADFVKLASDIEEWQNKYGSIDSVAMSPYSSESFGGYSYFKPVRGSLDGGSKAGTWQGAFASRLNMWRKI